MGRWLPFSEVSPQSFIFSQYDGADAVSLGRRGSRAMVKIPKNVLDNVIYLYEDEDAAKHGLDFGGTGFLVVLKSKRFPTQLSHLYAVTNWHVAVRGKASVIRINCKDGSSRVIPAKPEQWFYDEKSGYDIAVYSFDIDPVRDVFAFVDAESAFASKEVVKKQEIGPGEDVFMVGRFVDHDGGPVNRPAVRCGNISVMPTPLMQPTNILADSYCVDMHSRSGYYDQFPEAWPVVGEVEMAKAVERDGPVIKGLSGMTKVLPAWCILEVLNMPALIAEREAEDEKWAPKLQMESTGEGNSSSSLKSEVAAESEIENPSHKEDFMSLLGAASTAKPQAD